MSKKHDESYNDNTFKTNNNPKDELGEESQKATLKNGEENLVPITETSSVTKNDLDNSKEQKTSDEPYSEENYSLPDSLKDLAYSSVSAEASLNKLERAIEEGYKKGDRTSVTRLYNEIGFVHQSEMNLSKALDAFKKSLELNQETNNKEGQMESLTNIANVMYDSGNYNAAIKNFEQSLRISDQMNDKKKSSDLIANIAIVYENTYRYDEAIEYLTKSLELKKEINDKKDIGSIHKKIGNIYYEQNNYEKAIDELNKSLKANQKNNNKEDLSSIYNNLGAAYYKKKEYDKAIEYYQKSLVTTKETDNQLDRSITLNNIGNINFDFKKFAEAIDYYEKSLKIKSSLSFKEGIATSYHNIANSYFAINDYDNALKYYISSKKIAEEANYKELAWRNLKTLAKVYAIKGKYRKAYEYFTEYTHSKFESISANTQLIELREQYESSKIVVKALKKELRKQNRLARYEAEKNERERKIMQLEMENKKQLLKKQKTILIAVGIGSALILIFSLFITNLYRQKNKALQTVERQKKHITDGIAYAAKIQHAVLPVDNAVNNALRDYFIINQPRNLVGGDFYWLSKSNNKPMLAVADCTGHGVPGGFMSMLGITMLNEILVKNDNIQPHEILNQLQSKIMAALHQEDRVSETMDGMDISIVSIDYKNYKIDFAASYHSLYILRKGQIEIIKGDRIPIGCFYKSKTFQTINVQIEKGDIVYMTTDGYIDQIGQQTKKRFMNNRFKSTLKSLQTIPFENQKNVLERIHNEWKGNIDQTDDILVMGIKF